MIEFCRLPSTACADIIIADSFTYADGQLAGQGGWSAHSGAGNNPVQVISGAIQLQQGSGSREDVNIALGQTMAAGDKWTYEFDLTINGAGSVDDPMYFAHFKNNASTFTTRLFVTDAAGGDFTLGISNTNTTAADNQLTTALTFGNTYRVFGEYDFDTQLSRIWLSSNLTDIAVSSTTQGSSLGVTQFAFRQDAGNTSMLIDNLVVSSFAAVPEPNSIVFLTAGIAGLLANRRFRRLAPQEKL